MANIEQLRKLDESLGNYLQEEKRKKEAEEDKLVLTELLGEQLQESIVPVLESFKQGNEAIKETISSFNSNLEAQQKVLDVGITKLVEAITQIKIDSPQVPEINIPEVKLPQINVPETKVVVDTKGIEKTLSEAFKGFKQPTVNVPKPEVTVKVPDFPKLQWPKEKMPIDGWVRLMGVDLANPLPVQLRTADGKPFVFETSSSSSGRSYPDVWLKNIAGEKINPATEDTLSSLANQILNDFVSVKLFDYNGVGIDAGQDTDDNKSRLLAYSKIQGAGASESDVLKIAIENGAMSTAEGAILLAGVDELTGTIRQRMLQTRTVSGYNYLRTYDQTLGSIFLKEGAGTISGANVIPVAAFQDSTGKAAAPALDASRRVQVSLPGIEKNEDTAHSSGHTGIPVWTRRIDTAASSAGSSGDYATFNQDSTGQQYSTLGASTGVIGLDTLFDADADNTAQQLKASAGKLYSIHAMNINNADAFIQFFDLATGSVTVGTTTPKFVLHIPKGDATNYGHIDKEFIIPVTFATAITYAVTTTPTGAGDPTVGITLNGFYK